MSDSAYIFSWWFFLFLIGIVSLPFSSVIFRNFKDGGYGIAKILGILIISYLSFFLAIIHLLPFARWSLFALLLFILIFNIYIFQRNKDVILKFIHKNFFLLILEETIFIFGLVLWSHVRSFQPDINGLEKFMDYGFINSILESSYLPATDMWFSGKSINYYWFGHFVTALLTKLSAIPSSITYNLMLGTILGLSLSGTFSIVITLLHNRTDKMRAAIIGGLVSAILLNFAGNFHTPYYIYKLGEDKYWYPDATRFIGYNPETEDKTIHEFPMYSYVVSDLHAHLLNLPFVLLFISLLYSIIISDLLNSATSSGSHKQSVRHASGLWGYFNWGFKLDVLTGKLAMLGFLLGVMFMTNAWDFANYALLFGITTLFFNLYKYKLSFDSIYKTGIGVLIVISVALVTVLPFVLNFESIAEGVKLTHTKTPIWQLAILWGFPGVLTLSFLVHLFIKKFEIKTEDILVGALLTTSWILIALPEFIYVKDIYIASHYRANTMFKLTYQAFVMSYLTSGYIAISIIKNSNKVYWKALSIIFFVVLFSSILKYPKIATKSYYGELTNKKQLNGEVWLRESKPDVSEVIDWLRKNSADGDTILEAPGDSYTEFNVISSYTGLPTVSGWFVHEWLWRGSAEAPQERVNDIGQIYTTKDEMLTRSLLRKYDVKYVIIGNFEREKYPDLVEEKFEVMGEEVFANSTNKIYRVN